MFAPKLCRWHNIGVPFVSDLGFEYLAGPADGQIAGVLLLEEQGAATEVRGGDVAVIAAAVDLAGYRLDAIARTVADRGGAAIVLVGQPPRLAATTRAIAERAQLAILAAGDDANAGRVCAAVARALDAGAGRALEIASAFVEQVAAGEEPGEERLASLTGTDESSTRARSLALAAAEAIAARNAERARRMADAPIRSRGVILTELLLAAPHRTTLVADRARSLGLQIDGWHTVIRIELDPVGADELTALDLYDRLVRAALETARAGGGDWHAARLESVIVLVRMERTEPAASRRAAAVGVAERVRDVIVASSPGGAPRCGVGAAHPGLGGLRSSDAEARAALEAAAPGTVNAFDPVGIQRMLVEWYATDAARASVADLLQPLDELGGHRAEEAVHTLGTYLDHGGSVVAAARDLHLHRNAVAYRMRRIQTLLDLDLDDPDQRLALHLACRARSLSRPGRRSPVESPA